MRTLRITLNITAERHVNVFSSGVYDGTSRWNDVPQAVFELVRDWLDNELAEQDLPDHPLDKARLLAEHEENSARWNCLRQGKTFSKTTHKP